MQFCCRGEIPIFDDPQAYFNSLNKIKVVGAKLLLSAWDDPRRVDEIPSLLSKSEGYIQIIRAAVVKIAAQTNDRDMQFCLAVLSELSLPPVLANPLLLKSFLSCLN